MIHTDNPFGGWHQLEAPLSKGILLEIAIVALTIVCFVALDLYVLGLVLTVAGLAYLIFAMLRPERF